MFPLLPVLMLLLLQGSPTPSVGTAQVRLQVALSALQSELAVVESDGDSTGEDEPDRPSIRELLNEGSHAGLALRALALLLGDSPFTGHETPVGEVVGEPETTVPDAYLAADVLWRSGFVSAWLSRAGPA